MFQRPYRDALPAAGLASCGLRNAQDAVQQGFTCIRPATAPGASKQQGLWVASGGMAVLDEFIAEILVARKDISARRLNEKIDKEQKARAANVARAVSELAKVSGWTPDAVEAALDAEMVREYSANAQSPVLRFLAAYAPTWRDAEVDLKEGTYRVGAFTLSAVSPRVIRSLLSHDLKVFTVEMEWLYKKVVKAVGETCAQWEPTRPRWFPQELLSRWATGVVNGSGFAHPLQQMANFRAVVAAPVKVTFFNRELRQALSPLEAAKVLWEQYAVEDKAEVFGLQTVLKTHVLQLVHADLERFIGANPVTPEVLRNEFTAEEWTQFVSAAYVRAVPASFHPDRAQLAAQAQVSKQLVQRHLELAAKRCRRELPESLKDFYPLARSMGREITFYYGPTNSGKTYQALECLKTASSGAYLGPLRLLALEIFERLNASDVVTSLVTGELVQVKENARHTSATIEMLNLGNPVEVAVVDEVQMLADPDRGSAWLQAILGAPAKHLILLGSASALPAVRMLAKLTGERLKEVRLTRLNPLEVTDKPMSLADAPKGAALIVFSRQAALGLANLMRIKHKRSVSVIYGALSPEVRSEQARQFREGETDVLVSTDAIAMGLNLPVHTVVFTTVIKWNGQEEVSLDHSLTCQIAGRAGRFGLQDAGFVTATDSGALKYIRKMLGTELAKLEPPYYVGLNLEMAESISRHLETSSLSQIIAFFVESMAIEDWATPRCSNEQQLLAGFLDQYPLPLSTKLVLSNAPAIDKDMQNPYFREMVMCIHKDVPENIALLKDAIKGLSLEGMETRFKSLTLYSWMHYRFPLIFHQIAEAQILLGQLNSAITRELEGTATRKCISCSKPLAWNTSFSKCDPCFKGGGKNRTRSPVLPLKRSPEDGNPRRAVFFSQPR